MTPKKNEGNIIKRYINKMIKKLEENTQKYMEDVSNSEEILERKVVAIGNGAHINIPLKHLGKSAKVMIFK